MDRMKIFPTQMYHSGRRNSSTTNVISNLILMKIFVSKNNYLILIRINFRNT